MAEKKGNNKAKAKKKKKIVVKKGRAYVNATYNNTIITLTDTTGNVIACSSAGIMGFKGPKKATPYAAETIAKDAVTKSKAFGLEDIDVFVKGVGAGRDASIRGLHSNGLNIISIKDITPIPHNGCRARRPRRV
jgi:small subunit ribosomal protein S11